MNKISNKELVGKVQNAHYLQKKKYVYMLKCCLKTI